MDRVSSPEFVSVGKLILFIPQFICNQDATQSKVVEILAESLTDPLFTDKKSPQ